MSGRTPNGAQDGEELVVRGTNGRRTQIARARLKQWTPRAEARFLTALAATCNVKAACAAVGLTAASAYNHYQRWPTFAQAWEEALETGYTRIEIALVENACNTFDPPASGFACDAPIPPMTVREAVKLLALHRNRVNGLGGKRPGAWKRPPSLDDPRIRASILRKLEWIESLRRAREQDGGSGLPPGNPA